MKSFLRILLVIVAGLAIGYGGLRYGQTHSTQTTSPTPSPSADEVATPAPVYSTYTHPVAGFSLQYPTELTPSEAAPNFPVSGTHVVGQVFAFPESYATTSNLVEASITASAEDGGQSACSRGVPSPTGGTQPQTVTLGNYEWNLSTGGDQGAGQLYAYQAYSLAEGATCYRVYLSTHATNVEPKSLFPAFDINHFHDVLTAVVTSFITR